MPGRFSGRFFRFARFFGFVGCSASSAATSAVIVAASSAAELLTPLPSGTSESMVTTAPWENVMPWSPASTANTPAT